MNLMNSRDQGNVQESVRTTVSEADITRARIIAWTTLFRFYCTSTTITLKLFQLTILKYIIHNSEICFLCEITVFHYTLSSILYCFSLRKYYIFWDIEHNSVQIFYKEILHFHIHWAQFCATFPWENTSGVSRICNYSWKLLMHMLGQVVACV